MARSVRKRMVGSMKGRMPRSMRGKDGREHER
jgi:hypothetical protein